jgi:predicted RNase H-like HicB family nuclease
MRFELYLESGPQHRRTWVYVPSLPGCSTMGLTTEAALDLAAPAIRDRLDFLRRHGEVMPDAEPIEVVLAEHVIERKFLGFAQGTYPSDREAMPRDEVARDLRWAAWSREELIAAARAQPRPLAEAPARGGRPAAAILSHVAESEWSYVAATVGLLAGGSAIAAAIQKAGEEPWVALAAEREALTARLEALTPDELAKIVDRGLGKPVRSARRMFRRLLEHEWEHVLELRARLDG